MRMQEEGWTHRQAHLSGCAPSCIARRRSQTPTWPALQIQLQLMSHIPQISPNAAPVLLLRPLPPASSCPAHAFCSSQCGFVPINQSTNQPACHWAREPNGRQPASQPAGQPASQPASRPAGQPAACELQMQVLLPSPTG